MGHALNAGDAMAAGKTSRARIPRTSTASLSQLAATAPFSRQNEENKFGGRDECVPLRMPAMTAARGRALLLAAASVAAVLVVGGLHMAVRAACWCSLWHTVSSFAARALL